MKPPLVEPSDLYDIVVESTSFAYNATVPVGASLAVSGSGLVFVPIDAGLVFGPKSGPDGFTPSVQRARVRATPATAGVAGAVSVGDTLTWTPAIDDLTSSAAVVVAVEVSPYNELARQYARLVGTAFRATDASRIAQDFRARMKGVADEDAAVAQAIADAFVDTAVDTLGEWEAHLGLSPGDGMTVPARQARLLARWRARLGATPQAILAVARAIDATAALYENTAQNVVGDGAPVRYVFQWALTVAAATYADPGLMETLRAAVESQKPAHTKLQVGTRVGFRTDDPLSLTDRDLIGV